MKLFDCQNCGQPLYFENTVCESCGLQLGFLPELALVTALRPENGAWRTLATRGQQYRFCANAEYDVCNWLLPAATADRFCAACRQAIDDAAIGPRMLIYGTLNCRPGQRVATVLNIVETALIGHLTDNGHQLSNKLGTKLPVDVISFDGNLLARRATGRQLRVPKRRGRATDARIGPR